MVSGPYGDSHFVQQSSQVVWMYPADVKGYHRGFIFGGPINTEPLYFLQRPGSFFQQFMFIMGNRFQPDVVQVIQCLYQDDELFVYGPYAPQTPGTMSTVDLNANLVKTDITEYGESPDIEEDDGIKIFAGPRDDPFFFDFNQYSAILGGTATGFNDPGSDTFAGTNVMSTVVEVPKTMLGSASTINVWVETKRKS